jgi:hypothetical protein
MNNLAKNILKTIIWFDMFEYPLTQKEIFYYRLSAVAINGQADGYGARLPARQGQASIFSELQNLVNKKLITQKDNFYFLPNREEIIEMRKEREIESEKKLKRAKKAVKFLKILPFIKAVIVCNVLGYKNAKTESDIDFLIITSPKRIWTARWFATGFFKILNLRPNKKTIKDKFCFSFYLAEDGLNLENIKLQDDPYLIWWFAGLIPLYDAGGVFEKFLKENEWVKKYLPCLSTFATSVSPPAGGSQAASADKLKFIWEKVSSVWPDKFYQKIQLWIMPKTLKEMANKTPGVIITDKILKFHLIDRRAELAEKYKERIMNYEL